MQRGLLLFAATAGFAWAQGPGNGISKSTMAAETDPLGALAFMNKYFHTTPAEDQCTANVCQCKAGDSGAKSAWLGTDGRANLVETENRACALFTKATVDHATSSWTSTAIMPSRGAPGTDCSYKTSKKYDAVTGDKGYVVSAHDATTCCNSCVAMADCVAATYTSPWEEALADNHTRRLPPQAGEGFGLHLPSLPQHPTTGGLAVTTVEAHVVAKVGNMSQFDAWMDFNVGLYTIQLDDYLKSLSKDGVPFLPAKWTARGATMYSAFVHVPKSQLIVELIASDSSTIAALEPNVLTLEQRLSDEIIETMVQSPPTGWILKAVKVSRAATDLAAIDEFYVKGMHAKALGQVKTASIDRRCYLWDTAQTEVCFVSRSDFPTAGDFQVADMEKQLKGSAEAQLQNPQCNMNRWEDNHYAIDVRGGSFDYIVDYLKANPSVKFQCATSPMSSNAMLRYIYDPTGWAVQLDMQFSKSPSGCSTNLAGPPPGGSNPMCNGGTCTVLDETIVV
eukprot:NODE_5003_length_1821_cov_4.335301.p1 GENE.NODE_5003_length_1821_cov_4.335301~~NODE_5003_length_1821_cov_4.335301.p1  ORF type:complete len:507 (+),score=130.93 NODE_5003_length_1821_cov_4.335301:47-1567(+)